MAVGHLAKDGSVFFVFLLVCLCSCQWLCLLAEFCKYVCVCASVMLLCTCVHVCVHLCIWVYIYIYISIVSIVCVCLHVFPCMFPICIGITGTVLKTDPLIPDNHANFQNFGLSKDLACNTIFLGFFRGWGGKNIAET